MIIPKISKKHLAERLKICKKQDQRELMHKKYEEVEDIINRTTLKTNEQLALNRKIKKSQEYFLKDGNASFNPLMNVLIFNRMFPSKGLSCAQKKNLPTHVCPQKPVKPQTKGAFGLNQNQN